VTRSRAALFGALLLLLVSARGASAQELDITLDRIATAWHKGDAAAITAFAARAGISVDADGNPVGPLGPRQAAAVLRRVFDDRESLGARNIMTRDVGGEPARAFGEIGWTARTKGTTIPERATIFVAFVREDGAWKVTEIRIMR
jgi:hypothetical protein